MHRYFGFDIQLFQIAVPDRLGLDILAFGDQEKLMRRGKGQRLLPNCASEVKIRLRSSVFVDQFSMLFPDRWAAGSST